MFLTDWFLHLNRTLLLQGGRPFADVPQPLRLEQTCKCALFIEPRSGRIFNRHLALQDNQRHISSQRQPESPPDVLRLLPSIQRQRFLHSRLKLRRNLHSKACRLHNNIQRRIPVEKDQFERSSNRQCMHPSLRMLHSQILLQIHHLVFIHERVHGR